MGNEKSICACVETEQNSEAAEVKKSSNNLSYKIIYPDKINKNRKLPSTRRETMDILESPRGRIATESSADFNFESEEEIDVAPSSPDFRQSKFWRNENQNFRHM